MNDEVREHLTRDQRPFLHPESLQILQIHSFMTLLLFSSPHSSSTGFRSEVRNGHSRSLLLCSVTHFCVVFKVDTLSGRNNLYINWKFLFIVLMVEMGIFCCSSSFLEPLHSFVKLNYLLLHIRNILFVFFSHCDGWLREFRLCFPSYLYSVKQEAMSGYFMFIITLECSKLGIWMGTYFRDILLIRISKGCQLIVSNVYWENISLCSFPRF